jgi:hypothetical protein
MVLCSLLCRPEEWEVPRLLASAVFSELTQHGCGIRRAFGGICFAFPHSGQKTPRLKMQKKPAKALMQWSKVG